MLAFIIPLKSSRASYSWPETSRRYKNCLQSIKNQQGGAFHIVTVCHEIPEGIKEEKNHTLLRTQNPDPGRSLKNQLIDQRQKILEGFRWALARKFTHLMVVDADDLISNRLAQFVECHSGRNGWVLSQGYHWRSWTNRIRLWRNFHEFCGTSVILSKKLCEEFFHRYPEDQANPYSKTLHHVCVPKVAKEWGFPLDPLPFPGGVYVYTPWENLSYRRRYFWLWAFKRWQRCQPRKVILSPSIASEFGLPF